MDLDAFIRQGSRKRRTARPSFHSRWYATSIDGHPRRARSLGLHARSIGFKRKPERKTPTNLWMATTYDATGLLKIDRDLPYLVVYREPADRDDPGTARLGATEAAFLIAPASEAESALRGVRERAAEGAKTHGAFLLLEV